MFQRCGGTSFKLVVVCTRFLAHGKASISRGVVFGVPVKGAIVGMFVSSLTPGMASTSPAAALVALLKDM